MPSNVALMKATLCANEELQERVDLHQVGDTAMAAWRVLYTVLPRVITGGDVLQLACNIYINHISIIIFSSIY